MVTDAELAKTVNEKEEENLGRSDVRGFRLHELTSVLSAKKNLENAHTEVHLSTSRAANPARRRLCQHPNIINLPICLKHSPS